MRLFKFLDNGFGHIGVLGWLIVGVGLIVLGPIFIRWYEDAGTLKIICLAISSLFMSIFLAWSIYKVGPQIKRLIKEVSEW